MSSQVALGTRELLSDPSFLWSPTQAGVPTIVVDLGTSTPRSEFLINANRVDSKNAPTTPNQGVPAARAYASDSQTLYSLEPTTLPTTLVARSIPQFMQGTFTPMVLPLQGVTLGTPLAMAWSASDNALFVIDSLPTIQNRGFESGTLSGWLSLGASQGVSTTAHSGVYAAMLGATTPTNGDSRIGQAFVAPADATTLSFWYKMTCPDTVQYDWATAVLIDNIGDQQGTPITLLPKICTTNGWTQVNVNVIGGHVYQLNLTSHDDNYVGDPTFTLFDDVTLSSNRTIVRLLRIDTAGNVRTLWETKPVANLPTSFALSANRYSMLTLATTDASGYDVVVMSTEGAALRSDHGSAQLKSRPTASYAGITLPLKQAFSTQTLDVNLVYKANASLTAGVCGTLWLKSAMDSGSLLGTCP